MKRFCFIFFLFLTFSYQSCTDLDAELYSQLTPDKFYQNDAQLVSAASAAYTPLYGYWGLHELSDLTTDQSTCPVRSNGGWNDGGLWPRLISHDFRPNENVSGRWNQWFGGVSACNRLIEVFTEQLGADAPVISELRALRAFYFYILLDLFGNIPIETRFAEADAAPAQVTPVEAFAFIEKEVLESIDQLSEDKATTYAKMNKWVAYALLAKLYLNAERFGADAHWGEAAEAANEVINSGAYDLEPLYFSNFTLSNEGSNENIFVVPYDKNNATGFSVRHQALHQSSDETFNFTASPWGGFSVQEDFYKAFDEDDKRRGMFIVGQQYTQQAQPSFSEELGFYYANPKDEFKLVDCTEDFDNLTEAEKQEQPEDCNVFITPEITLTNARGIANYKEGARYAKYEYDQNTAFDLPNDFAIFRYADVLLMRAEALWRMENGSMEALTLVNQVRNRAGIDPLTVLTEDDLYWEVKKELALENHARNTTIRFGHYEDPWFLKTDADPNKRWFPIPQDQLQANTNLKQNPGY